MYKFLPFLFSLFAINFSVAQSSGLTISDNGAGALLAQNAQKFISDFSTTDALQFKFNGSGIKSAGVNLAVSVSIVTVDRSPKILATSKRKVKKFKSNETLTPQQIFNKNDLLFSNAALAKLKPGTYKLVIQLSGGDAATAKRFKTARKVIPFVWR